MSDDIDKAIRGTVEAYSALVQFDVSVPGQERALLYGAACTGQKQAIKNERLAWEIADFLPLALARPQFVSLGVKFDEHYGRFDAQGRLRVYRLLADEPVYVASESLATALQTAEPRTVAEIIKISVEYQTISAALARGSRAGDLEPGPPLLSGPDELCPPLDQRPRFAEEPFWLQQLHRQFRPWWKFW